MMKLYMVLGFGWVVIISFVFAVYDIWIIDYIAPILILMYGLLYVILSIVNFKKKRYKGDLIVALVSFFIGSILLGISYFDSSEIKKIRDERIEIIKQTICISNKLNKGIWHAYYITNGMLTIKINFIHNSVYSEVRTSPLIFGRRKIVRINCKNQWDMRPSKVDNSSG